MTADSLQTGRAKLGLYEFGRTLQMGIRDGDFLELDPCWGRNPLAGKGLDVLDGVLRGIGEELADQAQTFVV